MADQIVIPEVPDGWCGSPDKFTTFIDLININLNIIATDYEQRFGEEMGLPGVPPVTLFMPGVYLPGVDPQSGEFRARTGLRDRGYVGNRFGFNLGGEARVPWEFKGYPSLNVPGDSFTVAGVDPMRVVLDLVRANYEVIIERFADKNLFPTIDWSAFFQSCKNFNPGNLNFNNKSVLNILTTSVDGPAKPGSDIPTFGSGSCGATSCWNCDPEVVLTETSPDVWSMEFTGTLTDTEANVSLDCTCGAAVTQNGWYEFGGAGEVCTGSGTSSGGYSVSFILRRWSDSTCGTLLGSATAGCSAAFGPDASVSRKFSHPTIKQKQSVSAGEFVTLDVKLIATRPGLKATATAPFANFSTGDPGTVPDCSPGDIGSC